MADKKMSRQFLGMERHTRLSILGLFIVCVVVSVYYFYPRTLEVRSVDSFGVAFVGDAKLIIKDKITQELVKVVPAPKVSVALNGGYKISYTPDWFELPRRLSVDVCFVRNSIATNVVLPDHVYCQTPIDKVEYMCDDHNVWTKYFSELQVADLRTYCGKDRPVPVVAGEKDDVPELPPSINYYASTNPTTNTVVNNDIDMPECDQDEILVWDNNQWNCRDQGTFIVTYPNCAPGEVLTSILGVLTCVAGSTPTLLAQNGASIVPGGIIEFGLNPLLHDTVVPQAGFDMSFIGGTSGGFIQNYIDGVSGTLHGIESRDNLFGIPGVNGTLNYSSPNVGAIPFGGEGSYMYTIDGDAGFGSSDGLGERSFGSFFPTGFQMQHTGAAGGAVINGNASSVGIFGNDVSGSSSNGSFNGVAGTLTLTNNGPTSGMLANMLLDSNDGSLRYLGNNIAGHITRLDLDSAAATGQIYVQNSGAGIIQFDMQANLGRTSIYTQAAGNFNTFSLDQAAGLGFVSNTPPVFAPLTFGVSQLGDVTFDRELRPGGNAGNAGEVLTSQGVGLPPVWAAAPSTLSSANNGLSLSGSTVQLGGPIIQNTTITNNGFDLIFNGTGNASSKVATFVGDIDVTGTIDPTRILFSNLAGVNSPSYNPSANANNYSMRFEEGGNLNFQSNTTNDILHLNNTGQVGIGIASGLTRKLTVMAGPGSSNNGIALLRAGGNPVIDLINNTVNGGQIDTYDSAGAPVTRLRNNGTNFVLGNGTALDRFGVGTTGPLQMFHVRQGILGSFTAQIENFGNGVNSHGLLINAGGNVLSGSQMIEFRRPDGTVIGSVNQDTAASVAFNTTSDRRLKENIVDTNLGLDTLMKLQVHDYNYISDSSNTKMQGFIAQELNDVYSQAVTVGGSNAKTNPWQVDYSKLTPLLTKSIQDLEVKKANKNEIADLNAAVADINADSGSTEDKLSALNTNDQNFLSQLNDILETNAKQDDSIRDLLATLGELQIDIERLQENFEKLIQSLAQDQSGQVKIKDGDKKGTIRFAQALDHVPVINITPHDFIRGSYAVKDISKEGFELRMENEQDEDVVFDWHAAITRGGDYTVESDGANDTPVDGGSDEPVLDGTPPTTDASVPGDSLDGEGATGGDLDLSIPSPEGESQGGQIPTGI